METDKLIEALKAAEDENGIASRMTIGHIKRLAWAVRELAWMAADTNKDCRHGSDDQKRWIAGYEMAEAINDMNETRRKG